MIVIKMEPEEFLRNPETRAEFMDWALSDYYFVENLIHLLATGSTRENSWPWGLDELRKKFHELAGEEYLAEAMKRVIDAHREAMEARTEQWNVERRLKTIKDLLPIVFRKGAEHELIHGSADREDCFTCQFLDAIKGTEEKL